MTVAGKTITDEEKLDEVLTDLAGRHQEASMRAALIAIEGLDIQLWATRGFRLSGGFYRITWRYQDRSGSQVIVCFTLAETDS